MHATVREVGQGLNWCNAFLLVQFRTFETVQRGSVSSYRVLAEPCLLRTHPLV
jgi:hypothetical protein